MSNSQKNEHRIANERGKKTQPSLSNKKKIQILNVALFCNYSISKDFK